MNSFQEMAKVFAEIDNPKVIGKLFTELFTPSEIKALTLRWQLMKDIRAGVTQRKIAAKYKMSLCKVTRGSKVLKAKDSVCARIFSRIVPVSKEGKK